MAIPDISEVDLASFHAKHFSIVSIDHFSEHFLGPVKEGCTEEDDGLGYYDDGVKRTLTDEQIAIFRHSEIQALLRERRRAAEAKELSGAVSALEVADAARAFIGPVKPPSLGDDGLDDGEVADDMTASLTSDPPQCSKNDRPLSKRERKARKAKQKGWFRQHVKPDLRKRTWDKVDTGLGTLDYDEVEGGAARAPVNAPQRRKVTYDDD